MKGSLRIRIFAGLIALAVLGTVSGAAQFETNPDHFEFPGAQPFPQPRNVNQSSKQYNANFTLPYAVECKGTSLPAGQYSVSIRSEGKLGQATLKGVGRELGFRGLVREPNHGPKGDALIVELSGKIHRLAAIHIAALDLVFDSAWLGEDGARIETSQVDQVALTPRNGDK